MEEPDLTPLILDIIREHLESATPADWHAYADGSNYSDNQPGLKWLLDQPSLEVATALTIYWNLGAAWYVAFEHVEQVDDAETFEMLRLIETRVQNGFYQGRSIWFDPMQSESARPDDYPDQPVNRPVPPAMLQVVNGTEYYDRELVQSEYDDGLPLHVSQRIHDLFDSL
ncbi:MULTISPECIES: DUF4274 domain-containing protein [Pseudomonas syringae group]|uniref:DUF4274 domain-containing protein n=4 Tax=Pseudomonas syringae group TaxID=136849 RepID=A0AAD0DWH5_9PSED|nr:MULTISPECIES: DUF4274 domain-containing protein [Pseudomonas syringae group]AVB19136.1 DUF4274 domain-containing protein [Pseudomonas avellanae]EGH07103.1 hypothetical protein PSYMP_01911 [Pseudomonas amygdali pv. morsprunorum str. M302280]KWS63042.1 hypothetical protein AL055_02490 [Pseudomonas amygdali pv. morsprunorum]PHN50909.1 hypothetical protein AO261_02770 [Pseudomonas avellanae]POC97920.1 hypothetical protein BKM26_01620 [Pseudomonas avellanae]